MEFYDFNRLEIFKQYHDLHADKNRLEIKYRELWYMNIEFVCRELNRYKRYRANILKKNELVERKNNLCVEVKKHLANIVVDKFILHMLDNNKIKLNLTNMPNLIVERKSKVQKIRLNKYSELDEKAINALLLLSGEVLLFHKNMNSKLSVEKINVRKTRIHANTAKNYSSVDLKNIKLRKIMNSIMELDRKEIDYFNFVRNIQNKAIKETKKHFAFVNYLMTKVNKTEKLYIEETKSIDNKYCDIFKKNGMQMCSICLDEDCRFIKTNCGHFFHVECIGAYVQGIIDSRKNIEIRCPMCRQFIS